MKKTPHTHAHKRLNHIADLGYSIVSQTANAGLHLVSSTHNPNWTQDNVEKWDAKKDDIVGWLSENVGSISTSEVDGQNHILKAQLPVFTTLVSELCAGDRVGIVLSHSTESLDEPELSEATAAALIVQMAEPHNNEFDITAKELIYLKQVGAGATDDEIATELQLSLRAVKERKRKSIEDLKAKNIGHAVGIAKREGLI